MASFNNEPLALRTRGQLPGLFIQQESDAIVPSVEVPPPTVHIERAATPEPVDIAELERTPSPYIKKEPNDKRTHAAFPVEDDEGEGYDPRQVPSKVTTRSMAGNTAYDPARPIQGQATRLDRMLSSKGGKTFEPDTVCFPAPYRNKQLVHLLKCHGEVKTLKPKECGSNCKLAIYADKEVDAWPVDCTHPVCADARNKRHASIFAPSKKARTATPAMPAVQNTRATVQLPLDAFGTASYVTAQPARASGISKANQEIMQLNKKILADRAMTDLVHHPLNRTLRPLSKRHLGYATPSELKEEKAFEDLFKNAEGLDIGIDLDAIDSGVKGVSNGGEKRSGFKIRLGKRKAADAEDFEKHGQPTGADLENGRPWHYAHSDVPGQKSIRNQEAGIFSIPGKTYNAIVRQENGVIVEREDVRSHRLPRNADNGDEEGGGLANIIEDDKCAVCGEAGNRVLERCDDCQNHFHRPCARLPDCEMDLDGKGYLYEGPWFCDDCNKPLPNARAVCRHVECLHNDYCVDCARKLAKTHADDILARGSNPEGHRFVKVMGQLGPALKAIEDFEVDGFTCPDCTTSKQRQAAQNLASQMFGGKKATIAELETEVKRLKTLQNERMKEASFTEGMQDRIRNNQKRHRPASKISRPPSTPQRRSSRLGSSTRTSGRVRGAPKYHQKLRTIDEKSEDVEMGGA